MTWCKKIWRYETRSFLDKIKRCVWNKHLLLWWHRLWIRKDEFHNSLNIDSDAMMEMDEREKEEYLANLIKRRKAAHQRDLIRSSSLGMKWKWFILNDEQFLASLLLSGALVLIFVLSIHHLLVATLAIKIALAVLAAVIIFCQVSPRIIIKLEKWNCDQTTLGIIYPEELQRREKKLDKILAKK